MLYNIIVADNDNNGIHKKYVFQLNITEQVIFANTYEFYNNGLQLISINICLYLKYHEPLLITEKLIEHFLDEMTIIKR